MSDDPLVSAGNASDGQQTQQDASAAAVNADASSEALTDDLQQLATHPLPPPDATTGLAAAAPAQAVVPLEQLLKAAVRQGHRLPAGAPEQRKLVARLSHLHLNGMQLQQLASLELCPNLQVLYAYDNQLTDISLRSNRLLTHLYLQRNSLTSLSGLQELPLLEKLYVQNNCLSCIDHLTAATRLQELHVSDQQQPQQETVPLQFDPGFLGLMSGCLRVLAAAGCGIQDPAPLAVLRRLTMLDISRNNIRLERLQPLLSGLQQLRELDTRGNLDMVAEPQKSRDYVILLAADSLTTLDGEAVPHAHRAFLLGLHLRKLRSQQAAHVEQSQSGQQHTAQAAAGRHASEPQAAPLCYTLPLGGSAAMLSLQVGGNQGKTAAAAGASHRKQQGSSGLHPLRPPAGRPTATAGFKISVVKMGP